MNGARLPRLFWIVMALAIAGGVIAAVASFSTAAGVQSAHKDDVDRNFQAIECTIKLLRLDPVTRSNLSDDEIRKLCPILTVAEAHTAPSTTTTRGKQSTSTTSTKSAASSTAATRPTSTSPGRSPVTTGTQPSPPPSAAPAPPQAPTTTTTMCLAVVVGRCVP